MAAFDLGILYRSYECFLLEVEKIRVNILGGWLGGGELENCSETLKRGALMS